MESTRDWPTRSAAWLAQDHDLLTSGADWKPLAGRDGIDLWSRPMPDDANHLFRWRLARTSETLAPSTPGRAPPISPRGPGTPIAGFLAVDIDLTQGGLRWDHGPRAVLRLPTIFYAPLLASLSLLAGCPSPNLYATPRTVPKGGVSHTFALEGVARSSGSTLVPLPVYELRLGVSRSVDLGFRAASFSTLGLDVKWNPVRGPLELAFDPGFQGTYLGGGAFLGQLSMPVVAGINVNDWFSFVPSLGVNVGFASGAENDGTTTGERPYERPYSGMTGVLPRLGLGLHFRASDNLAVQPELTTLIQTDQRAAFFAFGLGFTFGDLPARFD